MGSGSCSGDVVKVERAGPADVLEDINEGEKSLTLAHVLYMLASFYSFLPNRYLR